jgi:hypothetical protein
MFMKERLLGGCKKAVLDQSASEKPQVISGKQGKIARASGIGAGFYSPGHTDIIPE